MMNDYDDNFYEQNGMKDKQTDDSPDLVLAQPMGEKKIPLFLEFLMTATKVIVLISGLIVAIVSIISKAAWYDVLLRVTITFFILGLFGVLLNYFIGRNYVEAALVELEEAEAKRKLFEAEEAKRKLIEAEEAESTMDTLEA